MPDVLLTDLVLSDGNGMDLLADVAPNTHVIVMSGYATVDNAVEALRAGVYDYLTKPIDITRLQTALAHIFHARQLSEEIGSLRDQLRRLGHFGSLVGSSPPMQRLYDLIGRVAPTNATVFLQGESGTGKEVVAQTLHQLSKRRTEPFYPLNCGAVSPSLIESELFGHERGSFTGADRLHKGYFERAHGGTILLDEITEMPIELQVKLLRVLETGMVLRLGGEEPIPVDVRVIAATNRDPEQAVSDGVLRGDLLYRLRVFPLDLPPLRERGTDVEQLAQHFLDELNRAEDTVKAFTRGAFQRLRQHDWPGNVRELRNLVHHAFILADEDIEAEHLPLRSDATDAEPRPVTLTTAAGGEESEPRRVMPDFSSPASDGDPADLNLRVGISIAEADRRLILSTLEKFGGDKKKAAEVLGVSLKTVYNRLNEYRGEVSKGQSAES
jgi:DNA-binding NtrC family response regulator